MRIAIVGGGVSGLLCAYRLHPEHEIDLYEKDSRVGGHAYAAQIETGQGRRQVDMAFLVLSRRTYLHFKQLLAELSVTTSMIDMCVTVINHAKSLVYNTSGIGGLFCRPRNIVSPKFWRLLADVVMFNHRVNRDNRLGAIPDGQTVHEYLAESKYSDYFLDNFFYPMASAPWSGSRRVIESMPATFFVGFWCRNLLAQYKTLRDWHTVTGSSVRYVEKLTATFAHRIHLKSAIDGIEVVDGKVHLLLNGNPMAYDKVILATSAQDALRLLKRPTTAQAEMLSSIPYEKSDVCLHRRFLPEYQQYRRYFSTWNVFVSEADGYPFQVTYDMKKIQLGDCKDDVFVSINSGAHIDPDSIIHAQTFSHPIHTVASWNKVRQYAKTLGDEAVYLTGAYMGYGFHEDGVTAAMSVVDKIAEGSSSSLRSGVASWRKLPLPDRLAKVPPASRNELAL